jgi:simple sugar transport system ATP-binding protein
VIVLGTPLLSLRGIAKRYGAVEALKGVDLDVRAGDVLGVCGDNGAGKSTLIRVISGAHRPDSGTMTLDGAAVSFRSPTDALTRGIATIYQDLALAPRLSIAQNVFMGAERTRTFLGLSVLDKRAMRAQTAQLLARLNQSIGDVDLPVSDLSGGQRQAVAIARALLWNARIIIMDEPTASLGVKETQSVLALIGTLRAQGVTIILVSHNMEDVVSVATSVAILKAGRKVLEADTAGLGPDDLAHMVMTGQDARAKRVGVA